MKWQEEQYRQVYVCGGVTVGAVYAPLLPGQRWRWRIWVTSRSHAQQGRDATEERARRHVESRFRAFLEAAQLQPSGGDA